MLTRLIDLCLRFRPIVLLATALLIALGLVSLSRLPLDAFPDTTPVQVQVNTAAPALSPLEVERQITFVIEQAIAGLPGLSEVRSISKFGFSQVVAIFDDDTDIYLARQVVSERLASATLPEGVARPALGPVSTGLGEVFQYVLHSDTLSAQELRTLHHWVIRPQMVQVPGVAEINTWGGYEKQVHVVVEPRLLVKHALTLDDVARALRHGNRNAGGGVLDQAGEALLIQGQGLVTSIADLEAMVLANVDGTPIRLSDVAEVREGHEIRRGAVTYQGQGEAVLGLGFMLMGENSRALTQRLEARLAEVRRSLPEGAELSEVYSRTELVDEVLRTVRNNLVEGALLVIAVLFAFLGNIRAGVIVALAIPLSMLFAFNAMLRFGIAGSLMSLGAIDFGLVVDSSVIMVENAARRLGEDRSPRSVREVVRDAAVEVRRPTLFGELIIAIVYLPVLALEGVEGKMFRPMALTVIFALAGSMLLSMTLMPVLASYVLEKGQGSGENRPVRWLRRRYRPVLGWALENRTIVLILAGVVVANAAFLASRLGSEFAPRLREQAIVINTVRMAGVSLDESVRYGTQIERRLLERYPDEIEHVWTRTGTAEVATDPMGLEVSDVFLTLAPRAAWQRARTQDELVEAMRATLEGMPGMRSVFTQPIEMRANEMIAGIRSDVGIKLFGDDFERLRTAADDIRRALERIPGAADVTVEQLTGQAMLTIEVDREAAGRYGIPVGEVLELVESLGTRKLGEVVEGQRRFDLVLRLADEARSSAERMGQVLIRTEAGAQVPLASVARVAIVEGPSSIQREWAKRRVVIQANVRERDIGSFVAEVRQALRDIGLPEGYYTKLGGQFENLERAQARLMIVVPIALLLIFSLLYLTYGRVSDALRVFTGVPFGAVGGIVLLWARDMPFSISAGVGFIALSGVAVLGDMVLVSYVMQLRARGRAPLEAIREAAETRLRPVLMTALVAALGFLPMAVNTGVGAEVQRPLATVVVGGMVTATMATLFVLPVLYAVFGVRRSEDTRVGAAFEGDDPVLPSDLGERR
ncbi:efflux RND transporter permease subunit [Haliangium ochraceum]|uniref:Heavy metal efflux pump, CzcA family n=1 Tax=Haliangium ochraceum (strain DSM 14365 / JCM 11303 / SMP-2) TaxID=502025 RepID=D0LUX9_HALO1|nr:CusA/CzcA family heavy metal efflux RND transporter [Haliangium ochraceum]ACY14019.1 heavy metal efflux pump, CzcA family [Haliangium ochraceum DSM 14365]